MKGAPGGIHGMGIAVPGLPEAGRLLGSRLEVATNAG